MTLIEKNFDLFAVGDAYYAHCISADFALGAGIAQKFNEKYHMRWLLKQRFRPGAENVGKALLIKHTFNLVTKERYFQKPTYQTLVSALCSMRRQMDMYGITRVAMPRIGCGLDRLDWAKVKSIILKVFGETDVEIIICSI